MLIHGKGKQKNMSRRLLVSFALLAILCVGCVGFIGVVGITHANAAQLTQQTTLPDTLVWLGPFAHVEATITDKAAVQALYEALYGLPHMTPLSPSQLARMGIGPATYRYTLQFFANHHLLKQVDVQAISFNGIELAPNDYRQATQHFWTVFEQTFHGYKLPQVG
jgi:hypothetical protein